MTQNLSEKSPAYILEDARIEKHCEHLRHAVFAVDNFMSGWGPCDGGVSCVAWACEEELLDRVMIAAQKRGEMRGLHIVDLNTFAPPENCKHFAIFVVERDSNFIKGVR